MDRSDVPELVDDPNLEPERSGEMRAWRDVERTLLDRWIRDDDARTPTSRD